MSKAAGYYPEKGNRAMIVQLVAKINLSIFVFSNTDKLSTGHSTNDCADNKVCLVMLLCLKSPPNLKLGR